MNKYIKKLRVYDDDGNAYDKQIDYHALANLPTSLPANGGHADSAERAEKDNSGNIITTTYATKEDVSNTIANLVNSAPEALNTLNELAKALGNDPNFATTILNQLSQKADVEYVDDLFNSIIDAEGVYY